MCLTASVSCSPLTPQGSPNNTKQHKCTKAHIHAALIVREPLPSFEITHATSQLTWSIGSSYTASASANIKSKSKAEGFAKTDSTQQDPYHPTLFTTYLHRARRNLYDRIQQSSAPASSRLSSVRPFQICASSADSLESASASAGSTTSQNSLVFTPRRLDEVSRHVFSQGSNTAS